MDLRVFHFLGILIGSVATFGANPAAVAANSKVNPAVRLAPFEVNARPVTAFGLSLLVMANPQTRQIGRVFVVEVAAGSEAEFHGVTAGTEIMAIDGKSVQSLYLKFDRDSEFRRLLVNRARGDRILLELVDHPGAKSRILGLTEGRRLSKFSDLWH